MCIFEREKRRDEDVQSDKGTRATFGLQGGMEPTNGNQGDHTTVLDGVSLKRVLSANGGLPDVPEGLTARVAEGATLSPRFLEEPSGRCPEDEGGGWHRLQPQ